MSQDLSRKMQQSNSWKSESCIVSRNEAAGIGIKPIAKASSVRDKTREYYKRYDHDEVPVKDNTNYSPSVSADINCSLTSTEVDRLEKKVYSQELQTDDSSLSTLESNIKFFRTTVQEIFDSFQANMRDYELYKKKFHEILDKTQAESIAHMEDFIIDMIHHIMSSETSVSEESHRGDAKEMNNFKDVSNTGADFVPRDTAHLIKSLHSVVEAFKNEGFTDSRINHEKSVGNSCLSKEETFNIYLLSTRPYVQIKMKDRHLLSENNIADPDRKMSPPCRASTENVLKVAAKKFELDKYIQQVAIEKETKEIPIRESCAKKDIYLDEDFVPNNETENKSFIYRICSFLCRKFRKNSTWNIVRGVCRVYKIVVKITVIKNDN